MDGVCKNLILLTCGLFLLTCSPESFKFPEFTNVFGYKREVGCFRFFSPESWGQ